MTIETATYINDLQPLQPPAGDPVSQGDDHLRLIKQVLQNTFTGATRAFAIPSIQSFSSSPVTITKAMEGNTVFVSTASGATTVNLPTLVAGDAGWSVNFYKTSSDANPMFITPPSGTLTSGSIGALAKARRCVPGVLSVAVWTGAAFYVTRASAAPIGSCIEYHGSALPAGFEWPNGQTLASASTNYPEYNAVFGSGATLDKRGRIGVAMDNLGGSAAGRLPNGYINGSTFGATGGGDGVTLATSQIPNLGVSVSSVSVSGSCSVSSGGGSNQIVIGQGAVSYASAQSGPSGGLPYIPGGTFSGATSLSGSCSATGTGSGTATGSGGATGGIHSSLQPSIMVSQILVVE